ncbi:MAG: hypothetical protein EAS51_07625 [Microbacteriaceae bacterium]|nr:MAG: hypothetical protein EAS51_07625 [Microbacteriaceae bacterium]
MTTLGHGWHRATMGPRQLGADGAVHTSHVAVVARLALFALATVVAVAVVKPPIAPFPPAETVPASQSETAPAAARTALLDRIDGLETAIAAATTAHTTAEGRVLDEAARTALIAQVELAEQALREANAVLVWPDASLRSAVAEDAVLSLEEVEQALVVAQEDLATAVETWEAEQARIAAEEAARAAAAAAAAAAPRTRVGGPAPAAGAGIVHIEGIWTSGSQAEIDACRGSVNVPAVAGYLGGAFYAAEHWGCGGSTWGRIGTGALVEFPGYGTFRVAGIVSGLAYGSNASAVPGGYAGYYQTCIGGSSSNMAVWLLQRA